MRLGPRIALCALVAVLLGGCAIAQPRTPAATWEPLPTLDSSALAATAVETPVPAATWTLPPTDTPSAPTATATATPPAAKPSATPTTARLATATPTASPTPELVDGWRGIIRALAPEALYDDYLQLIGSPRQYGIAAPDADLAERLESLRDTNRVVKVWGLLEVPADDYGGGRIVVERLEAEAPAEPTAAPSSTPSRTPSLWPTGAPTPATTLVASPAPTAQATATAAPTDTRRPATPRPPTPVPTSAQPSDLVEGWTGVVTALPAGAAYDDYFACDTPGGQYGIHSLVPALEAQLATHRASGCRIRIWGVLDYGVADYGGTRITVTRLEIVGP